MKTCFRDISWPERFTQWVNFLVGFWGPRPVEACVVTTLIFPPKPAQKNKNLEISTIAWISLNQSIIDESLRNFHKNFQPNWPKIGWVMAKKLCQNMGMHALFARIIWSCINISNETNVIWYVPVSYVLYTWFIPWFMLNCLIMAKTSKNGQSWPYLSSHFCGKMFEFGRQIFRGTKSKIPVVE